MICLEGTSNWEAYGSHGKAHDLIKNRMDDWRKNSAKPNTISIEDMIMESTQAIKDGPASHCDKGCLEAQLREAYKNCEGKDLMPADGTGNFKPWSELEAEKVIKPKPGTNLFTQRKQFRKRKRMAGTPG
ncbi:MAG: hypothetical protein FWG14_00065 [Peptococcaceae bacterium]|nr:hypothetical protein [Peptococcaceae bacterium]